jgi:hypothetical protein
MVDAVSTEFDFAAPTPLSARTGQSGQDAATELLRHTLRSEQRRTMQNRAAAATMQRRRAARSTVMQVRPRPSTMYDRAVGFHRSLSYRPDTYVIRPVPVDPRLVDREQQGRADALLALRPVDTARVVNPLDEPTAAHIVDRGVYRVRGGPHAAAVTGGGCSAFAPLRSAGPQPWGRTTVIEFDSSRALARRQLV